jgi:hypothetical protein
MSVKRGKRKVQPKFGPLTVGDDEYTVRLNPPIRIYADLQSGDIDRIIAATTLLVQDHPFVDEDDEPLPVGEWEVDQVMAFQSAYGRLAAALPPVSPPAR